MFQKGSPILTKEDVSAALELLFPTVEQFLKFFEPDRLGVHIAVKTEDLFFETDTRRFGEYPEVKRAKYLRVARGKRDTAWDHKKDTAMIRASEMRLGDVHWPGGVYRDGIAVGVSGARPYLDYLIASVIATTLKHMTMEGLLGMIEADKDFVD
jgi:hypothetical protein